jgi:hypothetical protein
MSAREDIQVEGANEFTFDNMNFIGGEQLLSSGVTQGFTMFTFDSGGFVNSYRKRVFERGFVYLQLAFESETASNCVIGEMCVEYTPTRKNIGVG